MRPKPPAASRGTHVAGAEVPKPVVLLRIPAGLVAMAGTRVGGMDPDLQPGGIISHLSQGGFLALAPAVGAHIQHLVFPLLHLLRLGTQDTFRSSRDQGSGEVYHFMYVEKLAFPPASQPQ